MVISSLLTLDFSSNVLALLGYRSVEFLSNSGAGSFDRLVIIEVNAALRKTIFNSLYRLKIKYCGRGKWNKTKCFAQIHIIYAKDKLICT